MPLGAPRFPENISWGFLDCQACTNINLAVKTQEMSGNLMAPSGTSSQHLDCPALKAGEQISSKKKPFNPFRHFLLSPTADAGRKRLGLRVEMSMKD